MIEHFFPRQVEDAYCLSFGQFNARLAQAAILNGGEIHEDDIPDYSGFWK